MICLFCTLLTFIITFFWPGSTVQMQDEEILRLNAEFELAASREMELRNRLEQSLLTLQIVERDLQASDNQLRSQLEHSLTLMRKAEHDVRMAEKNVESLEMRNLEKDRELESLEIRNRGKDRELESHYVMFEEKDIVILKQGEELKQAAAMRLRVMKELEQMGAQAELMAQMRDEVSRLKADLDSAEARSAELLKQADHLSRIAIQMTQTVAAHEKREAVTKMEREHACRLAARNRMLLGFTALLLNFQSRNCLGDVCDLVHANRSTAVKRMKCQAVFCAWQKNIQQFRRAEGIVARALDLRTHRAAACVFEGWYMEALEQRREEATQNRVLARHLKRRRRLISCQCLNAWRNHTVNEMRKAASIIRMMLLMIERSLAFAFHAWYNSAQERKRAKDDMELTNRCMKAKGDLERYQKLLAMSNKRLDVTQASIDAVIQASAGCAEALDAGIIKNFQRMSSLEIQLNHILKVSNEMRQKHHADHQQLRCWFRADMSKRILEVDALLHETHESKAALQTLMDKFKDGCRTLIDKVNVRWDHLKCQAVFCAWQKNIQQFRRAEGIVARALDLRTHRAAACVFEGWYMEALEQRREEATQNRVLARHLKRRRRLISCQCLNAWRNHTVNEMRKAASIIRMMLLMIERSLAFAFHAWYNSAQERKRAKDDMELTNRCMKAKGDLERYQKLLAMSNKRLDVTQASIDAVIQASAGCAEALDAGIIKNFQRMSSLEIQLNHILKVSNEMRQKHHADHQQLRCWFRADMSKRILEVDALLHETHESKAALQTLMNKIEKLASIRDKLQEALAAEKQRCADLDSLCKREQQDCQDLEKALEDVSRRLLQTEDKFHLAEAQNKELRDSLTFAEEAQAKIKIMEAYNEELLARLVQSNQQSSPDNSAQNHE
jgi:hypothetical protein